MGSIHGDTLISDNSSQTIYGAAGRDRIFGLDGDDFLFGQGGSDDINGGAGNDFIDAGGGYDRLVYNVAAFGQDYIEGFDALGNDYLDFRGSGLSATDLTIMDHGWDVLVSFAGNPGSSIMFENMTVATLDTTDWLF